MSLPRCKGRHILLVVSEYNAMGAVVDCSCGETTQVSDSELHEHYYHTSYVSGRGSAYDRDVFIREDLLDEVI